jgi:glyoxylase-like metal-dependent hydrolase (beta-lactamase superfamily II)
MTKILGGCLFLLALSCMAADDSSMENRGSDTGQWWEQLPRQEWSAFERIDDGSGWFEIYRIRPHIIALYEPGQFEEVISFLILGNERALLFDTGLGIGDIRAEVEKLTDLDVVVLNSHTHYDHVGGNHQFDVLWGRDTPFSRERMQGIGPEAMAEAVSEGWVWKPFPTGFDPPGYSSRPWRFDRYVEEGMQIDLGGISLEVIYTPGHAPDCISLLDRHQRMLFTGDTFYLAALYSHLEGGDLADYIATAERLASLAAEVDTLVTSHNVPIVEGTYLQQLHNAMRELAAGRADYQLVDGVREYDFGAFSILTRDPLPAGIAAQ